MGDNPFYGEDAADARHNTEAARRRRHETMPRTDQRSVLDVAGHDTAPRSPSLQDVAEDAGLPRESFGTVLANAAAKVEAFKDSELSFSFPHTGGVFTRLSRASVEDFGNLDLIDLRTLRVHLEEASFLVANALAKLERQR